MVQEVQLLKNLDTPKLQLENTPKLQVNSYAKATG